MPCPACPPPAAGPGATFWNLRASNAPPNGTDSSGGGTGGPTTPLAPPTSNDGFREGERQQQQQQQQQQQLGRFRLLGSPGWLRSRTAHLALWQAGAVLAAAWLHPPSAPCPLHPCRLLQG